MYGSYPKLRNKYIIEINFFSLVLSPEEKLQPKEPGNTQEITSNTNQILYHTISVLQFQS